MSKARSAAGLTSGECHRVYGIHAVQSVLQQHPDSVKALFVLEGRHDKRVETVLSLAREKGIAVETRNRKELDRLAPGVNQGLVAECGSLILASEKELELRWPTLGSAPLVLVLDGVMDPRNLGACLRCAQGAGVDVVLLPKRHSAPLSSVARKTASGAAETLFLVSVTNLVRRIRWLKEQGLWIIGTGSGAGPSTTAGSKPGKSGPPTLTYHQADLSQPTALVMGSEGRGMRALTRQHCDLLVTIPLSGSLASLNVSVATGILLFEARRQRQMGSG